MPITNGVIVAPFNTWTVSKFLGMGSVGDVATVVGKSMNGGMAFDSNGYIASGKTPYWNIFSIKSPAFWKAEIISGARILNFKLNSLNVNLPPGVDYIFSDFEGYKHDTSGIAFNISGLYNPKTDTTKITINVWMGQYNWTKLYEPSTVGIVGPIKFGVRVKYAEIINKEFQVNPYTHLDNDMIKKSITMNGSIPNTVADIIVKDANNSEWEFSNNSKHLGEFSKIIPITTISTVIINLLYTIDQLGNYKSIWATAQLDGTTIYDTPITINGTYQGVVNNSASEGFTIQPSSFTITIPANSTSSNEPSHSTLSIDWNKVPAIGGAITITAVTLSQNVPFIVNPLEVFKPN